MAVDKTISQHLFFKENNNNFEFIRLFMLFSVHECCATGTYYGLGFG